MLFEITQNIKVTKFNGYPKSPLLLQGCGRLRRDGQKYVILFLFFPLFPPSLLLSPSFFEGGTEGGKKSGKKSGRQVKRRELRFSGRTHAKERRSRLLTERVNTLMSSNLISSDLLELFNQYSNF